MDLLSRKVTMRSGKHVTLQPREFKLLEYLMRHAANQSRHAHHAARRNVWDYHFDPQDQCDRRPYQQAAPKRSKQDLEKPILRTIRNAGYRMLTADA